MAKRRRDDGLLVDLFMSAMHAFRALPLWAAVVAAPAFLALFVWVVPTVSDATSKGASTYGLWPDLIRAFSPIIGWFLGGMTLLGGVVGAGERWWERRKQERPVEAAAKPGVRQASKRTSAPDHGLADAAFACPECRRPMVVRRFRSGKLAGQSLLACTGYPDCKHVEPLTGHPEQG